MKEVAIAADGQPLKKGDVVKLVGDRETSEKLVTVPREMSFLLNSDRSYHITDIKRGLRGKLIVEAGGWWWAPGNIIKDENWEPVDNTPVVFDTNMLDV